MGKVLVQTSLQKALEVMAVVRAGCVWYRGWNYSYEVCYTVAVAVTVCSPGLFRDLVAGRVLCA